MDALYEAHHKIFHEIRKYHQEDGRVENSAVSVIVSVAFATTKQDEITQDLFLLKGAWYGHGLADREFTNGWNVAVIPLISPDWRIKLEQKKAAHERPYMKLNANFVAKAPTSTDNLIGLTVDVSGSKVEVDKEGTACKAFFLQADDSKVKRFVS